MTEKPRFLFIEINQRCNLRCLHCAYWLRDESDRGEFLTSDGRLAIIEDFARLNPQGTVVTCGGEQMLDEDDYFAVTSRCRELGLSCFSVVNGTCIDDDAVADRMILEGPSEITVSLNSHLAEIHDRSRGVPGAFDRAVRALRLLLEARKRLGRNVPVYAMAVVSEENYRDLDAFYHFVLRDLGADKLKLNFLQPTFGRALHKNGEDRYFADQVVKDTGELRRIIRHCDRKYGLGINPRWLRHVVMYLRSASNRRDALRGWRGRGTWYPICNSYDRNIMIDIRGRAQLCFATLFKNRVISAPGDLAAFWAERRSVRRRMIACTQYCGISHSVRRESATLAGPENAAGLPALWPAVVVYTALRRTFLLLIGEHRVARAKMAALKRRFLAAWPGRSAER